MLSGYLRYFCLPISSKQSSHSPLTSTLLLWGVQKLLHTGYFPFFWTILCKPYMLHEGRRVFISVYPLIIAGKVGYTLHYVLLKPFTVFMWICVQDFDLNSTFAYFFYVSIHLYIIVLICCVLFTLLSSFPLLYLKESKQLVCPWIGFEKPLSKNTPLQSFFLLISYQTFMEIAFNSAVTLSAITIHWNVLNYNIFPWRHSYSQVELEQGLLVNLLFLRIIFPNKKNEPLNDYRYSSVCFMIMFSVMGTRSVIRPFGDADQLILNSETCRRLALQQLLNETKANEETKRSVVISLRRSLVFITGDSALFLLYPFVHHLPPDTEKHFFTVIDKETVSYYTLCLRVLRVFRDLYAVFFEFWSANAAPQSVSLHSIATSKVHMLL